jgi:NAD(P)-dependent dehydrogenase (short-subunit alcohol dehydrogenase family)
MGIMERKVCVITGGAGSLGLASATLLLKEGARVMLVDNRQECLDRAVKSLDCDPNLIETVRADVSSSQ